MRWMLIDRFEEFVAGRRAVAVKCCSLSEQHLHDHFPAYAIMPNTLIIEGLAQTGGIMVGAHFDFKPKVVLAKIPQVEFFFPVHHGDKLVYTAEAEVVRDDGAQVNVTSHVDGKLQAQGQIFFAYLDDQKRIKRLFEPRNFVFTMKLLRVFDVGRKQDGSPVQVPSLDDLRAEG